LLGTRHRNRLQAANPRAPAYALREKHRQAPAQASGHHFSFHEIGTASTAAHHPMCTGNVGRTSCWDVLAGRALPRESDHDDGENGLAQPRGCRRECFCRRAQRGPASALRRRTARPDPASIGWHPLARRPDSDSGIRGERGRTAAGYESEVGRAGRLVEVAATSHWRRSWRRQAESRRSGYLGRSRTALAIQTDLGGAVRLSSGRSLFDSSRESTRGLGEVSQHLHELLVVSFVQHCAGAVKHLPESARPSLVRCAAASGPG
jgi:hypothetical protein